ncbi:MAG: hypothetical protein A3G52_04845 [Candidatus Taylorbacteria bacterium RIFCSPLOWO2_12_FULL_43_20]|uniref:Transcription regulator TrmB N-terminal domain-containing protein n=1 Tax=Candidatus Taylorbacteria bacterium RIFCSPLOWO2_12_FULL_43_20 TaxID=1802332 RepID=A0A1G2P4E4_9BACT|nr:MAG: hypothetical protein A3B98_00115 [Candidatus Taylorbacteria bacterium RIFCSPHIGHO2_02_FULL_43_55]OHA29683.1 MAG: hypothetical protein A3E92_03695 [Candidatus Taylorbacteria bacterium RIFCSPHIGHO2_12_FULL_42_34]OHA31009.1 MAG: hypothetical protein A3B09_01300 [Candidatus Taylorbacteria bacterium RIFCSPLOWO2_01_FULL_43_83]OHA38991.1 MAG: hypothetical protein A3H58_00925 [Candidatus Taylorbacteria bacterium RIFCSPLOWO2_02_FULL_43_22b]OHA42502.1 MAG: hypothetical protein A3G52_04845 [Candid
MNDITLTLNRLGLTDKEATLYMTLLETGPTAIRKIAEKADINRGTTYDLLKKLQQMGLVSYYHHGKHQHFLAEDPKVLNKLCSRRKMEINEVENTLKSVIPKLFSNSTIASNRPVIKFYENFSGVRTILEDVLDSVEKIKDKEYAAYSSSTIRPYLYHKESYPEFTKERIKRKIFVRTIALGSGGRLQGMDERKWLMRKKGAPTYTLIYKSKVAMISIGDNDIPHGLIIEDAGIYKTERLIFDSIWKSLR